MYNWTPREAKLHPPGRALNCGELRQGEDRWLDALGTHLLMELQECESKLLDDIAYVEQIVVGAALHANANILGKFFHKFSQTIQIRKID